jgi:hypothetical protein
MTACSLPPGGSTLDCWYGDGTQCHCTACQDYPACNGPPTTPYWRCEKPPPGCPSTVPAAGSPCNTPGASCGPDCSLVVQCTGGVWQWLGNQCPICAAPDTPLATPRGERPIASLALGDLVYSVDHDAIVAVPLVRVSHRPVANHHVMRVVLEDGAVLQISPNHPTADGRPFGELTAGSAIDDAHRVVSAELVPYGYDATYDVLPASSTGTYFAAGALVASTLAKTEP